MSNTLFRYFSKSPAPVKKKEADAESDSQKEKGKSTGDVYKVGDLVWSKLEGYPWWPSIVCNHPTAKTHLTDGKVHVQFFDTPPTRSWIKQMSVRKYDGSKKGTVPARTEPNWLRGCKDADNALELTIDDRLLLVVDLLPSDEEEDMDEDENSVEEDSDKSKENMAQNEETPKRKVESPKSPRSLDKKSGPPEKRRRRIITLDSSDESENEYKPTKKELETDSESASSGVNENEISDLSNEEPDSPVKHVKRKRVKGENKTKKARKSIGSFDAAPSPATPSVKRTPTVSLGTVSKLAAFSAKEATANGDQDGVDSQQWLHLREKFLKPEYIKDAKKRLPDHPDYDPRTLFIPEEFLSKQTPAMRQWWTLKSQHFDVVFFFKVGKFYELFHMDAVIGVSELGLIYMKGEHAHSGFPEIAYSRYSASLIEKGYKVARIEQTETPDMMNERIKQMHAKPTKFDKVVKREICRITSKGTKTYSFIDGESCDNSSNYLMAVTEKMQDVAGDISEYGVCFIDTSIGIFYIGQFLDDRHCSRLRTLVSHYPPTQVLYEKGVLTQKTQQLLNSNLATCLREALISGSEFWDAQKTLKELAEGQYFVEEGKKDHGVQWPDALREMLDEADSLGLTAKDTCELAIRSLGACVWYLTDCRLEQELLSMKRFEIYYPVDTVEGKRDRSSSTLKWGLPFRGTHMVLDGITLRNLELLQNSASGTLEGTLLEKLDHCSTPFGKRLLHQWVCSPLCNPIDINTRLDAVADLLAHQSTVEEVAGLLKQMPDLERLLSKIHTQGNATRCQTHPDSRAIFYEDHIYSKRKIVDFLSALGGFKIGMKIVQHFRDVKKSFKSHLLCQCMSSSSETVEGKFPDLSKELSFFDEAFDHEDAKKQGKIVPSQGVDEEFDSAVKELKKLERETKEYLNEQKNYFGCKVSYWGTGRNRFQLEVPDHAAKKAGSGYDIQSQKKGFKRFWTTETKEFLSRIQTAEDHKDSALKDITRRIFEQFDKHYKIWESAVQCLSVLDVLLSLSYYSRCGEGEMCRPKLVTPEEGVKPYIEIRDGHHPCITVTSTGDDFIPNDTLIGCLDEGGSAEFEASLLLVTGPNMGGKSTLMRQVGLIVVLAQLGCYTPASKCHLTPVDRIFTRLGAQDNIMSGESTFYVELSETSSILQHATPHSLVLVDELGRGTATYDGTAIASAVVKELANIGCRTLFSTHYHTLVEDFINSPDITLGHMACMVENENDDDPSQETITFLYKFAPGDCPKSYGFNAARLASIPDAIIRNGHSKAVDFEWGIERKKIFQDLFKRKNLVSDRNRLKELITQIIT